MFEKLQCDEYNEFFQAYQAFKDSVVMLEEMLSEGKDDPFKRLRHAKLTAKVDNLWRGFPREVKDKLTDLLILKRMLPSEVRKVLNIFGGEVKLA